MPVPSQRRANLMQDRLGRELRDRGLAATDLEGLIELHSAVMQPRHADFSDDHHPAYLHPARSVLVLLQVSKSPDPASVALAMVVDTVRDASGDEGDPIPGSGRSALEGHPVGWASAALSEAPSVLPPGHPQRLESLVVAPRWVRTALLAERLDQLRHLHLWCDSIAVRSALTELAEVEIPAAGRSDPELSRLLTGWLERAERYRLEARARARPRGS